MIETPQPSISELHKQWAKLEDEQLGLIVREFELNSHQSWLSPGQLEQLIGNAELSEPEAHRGPAEPIGSGE